MENGPNMRSRALRTALLTFALFAGGMGSASAFNWGTLSVSSDGQPQGEGYGSFTRSGYNTAVLDSTLRDVRTGGGRTFVSAKGYGSNEAFSVESGRRSDGGSNFAPMAQVTGNSGSAMTGYTGYVKVCQDLAFQPDPCSGEASAAL